MQLLIPSKYYVYPRGVQAFEGLGEAGITFSRKLYHYTCIYIILLEIFKKGDNFYE